MKLTILGASGSVGQSTALVVEQQKDEIEVEALVGGSNARILAETARRLNAKFAVLADETRGQELKEYLSGTGILCASGGKAVEEAVDRECDTVLAAIGGVAGLKPTYRALRAGRRIALANKESLVCAGGAFMREARRLEVPILPVDSEHNALAQALSAGKREDLVSAVLTASGGPFRDWPYERIITATPEEASAHPVWSMGQKINIDSASLMNKGLELIEAHHLFSLPPEKLDAIVHPQSVVHALAQWRDGAWTAELAIPDMQIPIANALAQERRFSLSLPPLDLIARAPLSFEKIDEKRFPCFSLARQALLNGGGMPTILNAANEMAVGAFLKGQLSFGSIASLIEKVCLSLTAYEMRQPETVDEALALDEQARMVAKSILKH